MQAEHARRYPVGAEISGAGVHFRVWAPIRSKIEVVVEGGPVVPLRAEENGYFSGYGAEVTEGMRYRFRLDDGHALYPDPATRFQPDGPHGPSQVIDPTTFEWEDHDWRGVPSTGQVLYEMHIGTFTPEGTWASASQQLPELKELGITAINLMPVADFPGRFGWGYDGTCIFAPTRLYGTPDDFRRFVNDAHAQGIGVVLDVEYSHLGPDGNFLREFAPQYFSTKNKTAWGDAFNYDGPDSAPVREFFLANAAYWVEEFHLDGLRLDATQAIFDESTEHILSEVARRTREVAGSRSIYLIAENESQDAKLVRPVDAGGLGLDAVWNDDLHHAARVALTGRNEGHYSDYRGSPQEFISAAKWGTLYQGQHYHLHKRRRGFPAFGVPRHHFIGFLENHDQLTTVCRGCRLNQVTSPGRLRALTAYLLLIPATPMLFQGQEFASTRPFHYFADHHADLAAEVFHYRKERMRGFRSQATPDMLQLVPDPADPHTFQQCKLDLTQRESRSEWLLLHKDLLALRKSDPAFRSTALDGAVLGPDAFVLRFFVPEGEDRLLVVNLDRNLHLNPVPEPLLAPPAAGMVWQTIWSSENAKYGGHGSGPLDTDDGWYIPSEAAVVLAARQSRHRSST